MNKTRIAAVLLPFALSAVALAAIVTASTKKLSVGTSFSVDGTGFSRNPSVWLELGERKIPLRIRRGKSDTHVDLTLTTVPQGVHGVGLLRIRPQGAKVAFSLAGMSVELPSVAGVVPQTAAPGTEVTIDGSFFGTKKGHVTFGDRRGKVTSWSDGQIKALVPAGLAAGGVYLTVQNRSGASEEMPVFTVQ